MPAHGPSTVANSTVTEGRSLRSTSVAGPGWCVAYEGFFTADGRRRAQAVTSDPCESSASSFEPNCKAAFCRIPRIWGAPGEGETCDGCDLAIDPPALVMEGISLPDDTRALPFVDRRKPLQLHVECFYLWDHERRA